MARNRIQSAAELAKQITEAEAVWEGANQELEAARTAYREALEQESTGQARTGTALAAKAAISTAEVEVDLAAARLGIVQEQHGEAQRREARERMEQLAESLAQIKAAREALIGEINAAAEALGGLLDRWDAAQQEGLKLVKEHKQLREIVGEGEAVSFEPRRVTFSYAARERFRQPLTDHVKGSGWASMI